MKGDYNGDFKASLQSNITGEIFGSTVIKSKSSQKKWVEHAFELTPKKNAPSSNNTFALTFDPKVSTDTVFDTVFVPLRYSV